MSALAAAPSEPSQAPHRPSDWPAPGPIDLAVHDLPHASASTEWWYVNAHLETAQGRNLALFASFFRIVKGRDEATQELQYAHSVTWALADLDRQDYWGEGRVDRDAPALGLAKLDRGEGPSDERMRRAIREVLEKGKVPYPDRVFDGPVFVGQRKLELDYSGHRFAKRGDGKGYDLELFHDHFKVGCRLTFAPDKPAVRHGVDGVVKGHDGADMFYYFVPRCRVSGTLHLDGYDVAVSEGSGWYDHEFGGHPLTPPPDAPAAGAASEPADALQANENVAWNWTAIQLDDGTELTAYQMEDLATGESLGQQAILVDAEGGRHAFEALTLATEGEWRSTRTFNSYPTRWRLEVPELGLKAEITAAFPDQEFITVISKPAFWEGRCEVTGTREGRPIAGRAWLERSGYVEMDTLEDFFRSVSKEVRRSVADLMPFEPTFEQVRDLIASEEREHYMEGVDLEQFVRTGVKPVREITDRGGKAWRSYAALACCDIVGGDSRDFVKWLAMPELMHVGSLIVDDVQDRSDWRRGGPSCHAIYGEAIAINAGTAAYFMGQKLLQGTQVSSSEKLRLYDLYFEALRAGHAGQAADLEGLDRFVRPAVETGDSRDLEQKVLAVHRLKTAAPASALARMGAIVGGGSEEQIEGVGRYFESLGLAFQIIDDVLNLRGFKGDLKSRGEDIEQGKLTLPVAKAMARLERERREWLWATVQSKPVGQREVVDGVIEALEGCGAIEACSLEARALIEAAWHRLDPLVEDSIPKIMLRSFGWFILERHY